MNEEHLRICSSPQWAEYVEQDLLPWALARSELGDDVLEIGPGPGLTTNVIRQHVASLTAVEIDPTLAAALTHRFDGTNVTVVCADGAELPFSNDRFSGAAMFTMLHHVPSSDRQDLLLSEVCRVLGPDGLLVGSDSRETPQRWLLHEGDVYVPVDPGAFAHRLSRAGFVDIIVEEQDDRFRFLARTPPRRNVA
jgi:SAM-dependent methyltransferase